MKIQSLFLCGVLTLSLQACLFEETAGSSSSVGIVSSSSSLSSQGTSVSSSNINSISSSSQVASDLYERTFTMGGGTSSYPSYLDADLMQTYSVAQLPEFGSTVDLVFDDGSFFSPMLSSNLNINADTWFVKVPVSYESITTQAEVATLWDTYGKNAVQSVVPSVNDVYVVYTSLGKARLFKVKTVQTTTMTLTGAYK